jgi:hypothetical protein
MESRSCWKCLNSFVGIGTLCSNCQQTEALQKEGQENRELQQKIHAENIERQYQFARIAEQTQLESQRAAARSEQLSVESYTSEQDAYEYGLTYIAEEFGTDSIGKSKDNPDNLQIGVRANGELTYSITPPYVLPHLLKSFYKGVWESLWQYKAPSGEFVNNLVFEAGNKIARGLLTSRGSLYKSAEDKRQLGQTAGWHEGNLFDYEHYDNIHEWPSWQFIVQGYSIEGTEIYLEDSPRDIKEVERGGRQYAIKIETQINEITGEINYRYPYPFRDETLNMHFRDGVNAGTAQMNSEGLKHKRLTVDVPQIHQTIKSDKIKDYVSLIWYISIYVTPFLGWWLAWQLTVGWNCFFSMLVYVPLISALNCGLYVIVFGQEDSRFNRFNWYESKTLKARQRLPMLVQ